MAFTLTSGDQIRHRGTFNSYATHSVVTTTATQTLTISKDAAYMYGPTATITNFWALPDGDEGQELLIKYVATGVGGTTASSGDVHILPVSSNLWPQSSITFRKPDQFWYGKFFNGKWRTLTRSTWEYGGTTASGAIPLTVDEYRLLRATGTDQVFSMADGLFSGQEVTITALTGTTPRTVTPTTMHAYTSVNMGGLPKRWAVLRWGAGSWQVVSPINLSTTGTDWDATVIVT